MKNASKVTTQFTGKHSRIGIREDGKAYLLQPVTTENNYFWYRRPDTQSELCKEFMYLTILNDTALEHYINSYNPTQVYVNDECIHDDHNDVEYSLMNYIRDMNCLIQMEFYPFIKHVTIDILDNGRFVLNFSINIEHVREENYE